MPVKFYGKRHNRFFFFHHINKENSIINCIRKRNKVHGDYPISFYYSLVVPILYCHCHWEDAKLFFHIVAWSSVVNDQILILFLTSSAIYGIELSGKGDTQLTFISHSEYFSLVFSVLILLMKKSASHITGSISFLIPVISCNCATQLFSIIFLRSLNIPQSSLK
jgi:hypothetical protein